MLAKNLPISSDPQDMISINPKDIFGHKRKSIGELESSVCVKNMCLKNKDVFAASIIIKSVTQSSWM